MVEEKARKQERRGNLTSLGAQRSFLIESGNRDRHWRSSFRTTLFIVVQTNPNCLPILVTPTPNTLRLVASKLPYGNNQPQLEDLLIGRPVLQ